MFCLPAIICGNSEVLINFLAVAEDLEREKMDTAMGDDRKMMKALKGIKGLKITTDPEVSIEFTPDKKP